MLLRTWNGAAPRWDVSLAADGSEVVEATWDAFACEERRCLPPDTFLSAPISDTWPDVKVGGGRICFDGMALDQAQRVALVVRQGAYSLEFGFAVSHGPAR